MFSIGEFSTVSGITVRTLRFYHEIGLLVPATIDSATKYRTYDERNLERAKIIVALRSLEFTLEEIQEILTECRDDAEIIGQLERQKKSLTAKVRHYQSILATLDDLIEQQNRSGEVNTMNTAAEISEVDIGPVLVAGIRMKGFYADCGQAFSRLGRSLGRHIAGKPLCLFYDGEYREGDANFEPCMPVRKKVDADGINVHELPAVRCAMLLHRGPYEELKTSYGRLLKYVKERGYKVSLPTREVYLKGPGMIFRGNPKNYITQIQFPIENS
jgi:DNA-binding transcriptional MerR regulator/effector-binding domain-containing protein